MQVVRPDSSLQDKLVKIDLVLVPGLPGEDGAPTEPLFYAVPAEQVEEVTREFHGHGEQGWSGLSLVTLVHLAIQQSNARPCKHAVTSVSHCTSDSSGTAIWN